MGSVETSLADEELGAFPLLWEHADFASPVLPGTNAGWNEYHYHLLFGLREIRFQVFPQIYKSHDHTLDKWSMWLRKTGSPNYRIPLQITLTFLTHSLNTLRYLQPSILPCQWNRKMSAMIVNNCVDSVQIQTFTNMRVLSTLHNQFE